MYKRLTATAWLIAALTLSGCAFTMHDTPLNYEYTGVVNADEGNVDKGVSVGTVTDERTVDAPNIISHLVNGYGQTTSGGYVAEMPIADIVKRGLEEALVSYGYSNAGGGLSVDVVLEDYEYDAVSGFWSVKNITSQLTVGIRINHDGQLVARNTVIGTVKLVTEELKGKPDKELVVILFNRALDDAIAQIIEVVAIEVNRS